MTLLLLMTKFDQLKKRFPNLIPVQELRLNVSIIELAIYYGYEAKPRKGRSRPVLENVAYDDLILIKNAQDAGKQVYQRVGNFTDSGTIIDFIRNRLSTVFIKFNRADRDEFKNILDVLYDYLRVDAEQTVVITKPTSKIIRPIPQPAFALDLFDVRPLERDNYLLSRCITQETINSPEFTSKILSLITYFDPQEKQVVDFTLVKADLQPKYIEYSNVAFPYYNGLSTEVTGLEIRNEKIKLHAPGSERNSSVFISNPPLQAKHFLIFESAIDALSHKQLRCIQGDKAFNSIYFSTGGQLTSEQIDTIVRYIGSFEKVPDWKINLAFDNDAKGHVYDLQFIQQLLITKFPLHPLAVGFHKQGYALPTQQEYSSFKRELLDSVKTYNEAISLQLTTTPTFNTSISTNSLITIDQTTDQITLNIPENRIPLSFLSKKLLELSGLDKRVSLVKSITKDFNQDLTQEFFSI